MLIATSRKHGGDNVRLFRRGLKITISLISLATLAAQMKK